MAERPRVVILGGGFAGIGAAKQLKGVDADVLLVDEHDYHTFQPLLYQVATDLLEPSTVGHPLRDLFLEQPNPDPHGEGDGCEPRVAAVRLAGGKPLPYDYLVLALGAGVNEFGIPRGRRARLPDVHARRRRPPQGAHRRTVGGGRSRPIPDQGRRPERGDRGRRSTGVESAGALIELYRTNLAKDYPDVPKDRARVILTHDRPGRIVVDADD